MSDATCAMMFAWERCTHDGIGQPGCPVCDPDKSRVMLRAVWLDKRDARADLAKAQARVAELEAALRGYVEAVIEVVPTTMSKGGVAHSLVLSPDRTELGSRALASDGTEALAAVRLAQGVCDELLTSGASIFGDGRLSDEMRAQVVAAIAALDQAFGSGT